MVLEFFREYRYEELTGEWKTMAEEYILDWINSVAIAEGQKKYTKRSAFFKQVLDDHIYIFVQNEYTKEISLTVESI